MGRPKPHTWNQQFPIDTYAKIFDGCVHPAGIIVMYAATFTDTPIILSSKMTQKNSRRDIYNFE